MHIFTGTLSFIGDFIACVQNSFIVLIVTDPFRMILCNSPISMQDLFLS